MQRRRLEPKCPDSGKSGGSGSMTLSYLLRYGFQGMDPTWVRRSHEATLLRPSLESMPGEGASYASFRDLHGRLSFGIEYER